MSRKKKNKIKLDKGSEIYIHYGGLIPKKWVIHHIDLNYDNYEFLNLLAMPEDMRNELLTQIDRHKQIVPRAKLEAYLKEKFPKVKRFKLFVSNRD